MHNTDVGRSKGRGAWMLLGACVLGAKPGAGTGSEQVCRHNCDVILGRQEAIVMAFAVLSRFTRTVHRSPVLDQIDNIYERR